MVAVATGTPFGPERRHRGLAGFGLLFLSTTVLGLFELALR